MKKNIVFGIIGLALIITGCNNNSYSSLRNQEDKLIANYISRNNLNILTEEPDTDYEWGEKDYYKVEGYDNLYFHLISRGDSIDIDSVSHDTTSLEIGSNDYIIVRYKQFALTENADTLSYWTTLDQAYPVEFHYLNTTECDCYGWHIAIGLMKYPESQCEVLVPSKLGFSNAQTTVTPYMYILKIKVKQ